MKLGGGEARRGVDCSICRGVRGVSGGGGK